MRPPWSYIPLLPFATVVAVYAFWLSFFTIPEPPLMAEGEWRGIVEERRENSSGQHLYIRVSDSGARALLTVGSLTPCFHPGDIVECGVKLSPLSPPPEPENDYATPLLRRGISMSGYTTGSNVNVISRSGHPRFSLRRMRDDAVRMIAHSGLDGPTAEFVIAVLVGDTSYLPGEVRESFSASGLSHVLALSGMHVAIMAAITAALLAPLRLLRLRKLQLALTVAVLWVYAALTGFSPSVTRAVIMATTLAMGFIIGRRYSSANSLLLAFIIILVADPRAMASPGFLLSFAAVGAILMLARRINPFSPQHRVRYGVASGVSVTVAATIGTAMLAAVWFHSFPVYFIAANLPVVPLLPVIIGGALLLLLLNFLGMPAAWLVFSVDWLYGIIMRYVGFITSLPGAVVSDMDIRPIILVPYFIAVGALAWLLRARRRGLPAAVFSVAVTVTVIMGITGPGTDTSDRIYPLRKGAGRSVSALVVHADSAMLVSTAQGHILDDLLCQTERSCSDMLRRRGIKTLVAASDSVDFGPLRRRGNRWTVSDTLDILVATSNSHVTEPRPDIIVLGPGCTRRSVALARSLAPDSIIAIGALRRNLDQNL